MKFSFIVKKPYNKTVIDFNFGGHEDLTTLKSDIHIGLTASVNITLRVYKSIRIFLRLIVISTLALRPR